MIERANKIARIEVKKKNQKECEHLRQLMLSFEYIKANNNNNKMPQMKKETIFL